MHLLILGLFVVVGILVYYIMTTSPGSGKSSDGKKSKLKRADEEESKVPEDLRKEDNVIFLPNADQDASDAADVADAADVKGSDVSGDDTDPGSDENA